MTLLATTHPTLIDVAKRLDPDGSVAKVVEILNQTNEILDDMVWLEGNMTTGNKTTVRTGIPAPTWRKLNYGVVPGKSTTAQVTDSCGMLEAYAECDKALVDMSGDPAAFRLSEDRAYIEGFNQEVSQTVFYGNDLIDEAEFTGLSARFNSLSAESADNIVFPDGYANAGGTAPDGADNASVWLVCWGPDTVFGMYPKGSKAGLSVRDMGEVTTESPPGGPTGGKMQAYRTHYKWDCGLVVRDWRYVVRGQFNQEDLTLSASSGPKLIDLMTLMVERLPDIRMGRCAFYMNRRTRAFLRTHISNKIVNSTLSMDNIAGRRVLSFDDIPVRRVDQLLSTETAVS
jgi:hypothetical protein